MFIQVRALFFDKQRFSYSVPLQFWSCFEACISFHLSIKYPVFRITTQRPCSQTPTCDLWSPCLHQNGVQIHKGYSDTPQWTMTTIPISSPWSFWRHSRATAVYNRQILTSLPRFAPKYIRETRLTFKFGIDVLQNSPDQLDNGNDGCSKSQRTGVIPTTEK